MIAFHISNSFCRQNFRPTFWRPPEEGSAEQRTQRRKDNTRRKIIAGAIALKFAEDNPASDFTRTLFRVLDQSLSREDDRALFEFDEADQTPANDPGLKGRFVDRALGWLVGDKS